MARDLWHLLRDREYHEVGFVTESPRGVNINGGDTSDEILTKFVRLSKSINDTNANDGLPADNIRAHMAGR